MCSLNKYKNYRVVLEGKNDNEMLFHANNNDNVGNISTTTLEIYYGLAYYTEMAQKKKIICCTFYLDSFLDFIS